MDNIESMNKKIILKRVNIILFLDFTVLALSGLLNRFIPYEIFRFLHPVAGGLMVLLVIMHLYLNWNWVKSNLKPAEKK